MKIEIKHRTTETALWSGEAEDIKSAMVTAVKDGTYLGGAYLSGTYLGGANLCGTYLCGADLSGADLCGANLCGTYLSGANLCGANLCGANLSGANLCGANLCGANLSGTNLCGANLCCAKGYLRNHEIFAHLTRSNIIKFTVKEQEVVFRIVGLRLCWDSIAKEYGKTIGRIFGKLEKLGWGEYADYWKKYQAKEPA